MDKVDQIFLNDDYKRYLGKIMAYESNRIFCKHDINHFLDVARIAWINCLESGYVVDKEIVYGCALLHDIGRWCQYETGEPHDKASIRLAKAILMETSFSLEEQQHIMDVIGAHRDRNVREHQSLQGIFYRADKASRACHQCSARDLCDWSDDKKNKVIEV